MPRLPNIESLGERPIASPARGISSYRGESGAETVTGEAVMRFGSTVERAGDVVYKAQQEAQEKFDKVSAEEAFNSYRERQIDLTIGEKNGFVHRKGKAAADGTLYPQFVGNLNNSYNEISGGLLNDRQRELFRQRADITNIQYKENLLRHITEQSNQQARQTVEAGLALEHKSAGFAWRDPNAIKTSLLRSEALLVEQAEREGWKPDASGQNPILDAKRLEQRTKIHTAVINTALANDQWQYAQNYYRQNKGDIADPNGSVAQALEEGGLRGRSQANADRIMKEYRDPTAALEAARQIKDPKVRDATVERVHRQISEEKNFDARRRNALFVDATSVVEQTGDTDRIDPARWAELGPDQRSALKDRATHVRNGTEPKQNDEAWLKIANMAPGALARIDEAELMTTYRPNLDAEHWAQAVTRWRTARDAAQGKPEALVKIKDDLTFEQRFNDTVKQSGLLPKDKTIGALKGDQAGVIAQLRKSAADDLVAYKRASGKDYVPPEEVQRIINRRVLQSAFIDNPYWFGGETKPITLLTPEERTKAVVPMKKIMEQDPSAVVKIKNYARSLGVNASDKQIERAYFVHISGGSLDEYQRALGKK